MSTPADVSDASHPPRRRPRTGGGRAEANGRRRTSHSLDAVVSEAVAILDSEGEAALTFRALAARLGGGVASIYWYVSNKEELLGRAADHVLAGVLADTADIGDGGPDPIEDVRTIALAFYRATVNRPWLGAYFLRDAGTQPNGLALYDRMGRQLMRLDLTPKQQLDAVSAVMAYVIGVAADRGQDPPDEGRDGPVEISELVERFRQERHDLGDHDLPFLRHVADAFATHHDDEQFAAGLDLLLAGLRVQAGGATSSG